LPEFNHSARDPVFGGKVSVPLELTKERTAKASQLRYAVAPVVPQTLTRPVTAPPSCAYTLRMPPNPARGASPLARTTT